MAGGRRSLLAFWLGGGSAPAAVVEEVDTGYEATVLMEFSPGVWTDVSEYVMRPVTWSRGIQGNGPADNVALPGSLQFTLDNSEKNALQTLGLWSPNHPDCMGGFRENIAVQLLITAGDLEDVPVWTGKIATILPSVGVYGDRRTQVLAHDCMEDLAKEEVLEIDRQIEKTEVEVLDAILDAVAESSQPVSRDFDAAEHEFPVALDDMGDGETALSMLERVVTSARGSLYPLATGALKYQSFESRLLEQIQFTFDDTLLAGLQIPSSLENVFGKVRVKIHPKTFLPTTSPAIMVLASHEGTLAIAAGQTVELFLSYRDPDRPEVAIGGTDFEYSPTSPNELDDADYEFNSVEDGSGLDLTSSMIVIPDFFASAVKLTVTNTSGVTAYRQLLQVRGRGIYDQAPSIHEASADATTKRTSDLDFPYQDDGDFAQGVADLLQASYRNRSNQVQSLTFYPTDSVELMEQALEREIGEVIEVSEEVALPIPVSAYIQSISGEIDDNDKLTFTYGLAPRIVLDELRDVDTVLIADVLAGVDAAPETRIGFMEIGFGEIG